MKNLLLVDQLITSYQSFTGTSNRVLLFLHGRGRTKEDWKAYFTALEKRQISFLALDFPGFGGSEMPNGIRGVKEYSEFVLDFLDKLHIIQPVEIVAHSFGGRIAFYLAANAPARVSKLWLIAPGGIERGTHSTKKLLFTIGKILLPKTLQHHLKKRIGSVDYQKAGKLQSIFKKVVNEDLREFSVQVFQPLSLYWGEKDDQIRQWQIDVMREHLPKMTFRAFPNGGHDIHHEKLEEILSDMLAD